MNTEQKNPEFRKPWKDKYSTAFTYPRYNAAPVPFSLYSGGSPKIALNSPSEKEDKYIIFTLQRGIFIHIVI